MNTKPYPCGAPKPRSLLLSLTALSLTALLPTALQAAGTITGQVIDKDSGKYLESAEVTIEAAGTTLQATTERGGKFTVEGVSNGSAKVTVNYPGLEATSVDVTVTDGQATQVPVSLASSAVVLEAVTVTSAKQGMAQALALQKVSIEQKVIAAGDQFGDINEGNIAEYLKYLPGVAITYNANDARTIGLRGVRPNYTIIGVDGNPMATGSSSNDARNFETEQVAMTAVEFTEVYKTVSANMPASSTGGYVNLVSRSAFDREGRQLAYNAYLTANNENLTFSKTGAYGNRKTYRIHPNFEVNYADRFGKNKNIGLNINVRNSEIDHEAPRSQYGGYVYDPKTGSTPDAPLPTTWNTRMEEKNTVRRSIAGRVDVKLGDNTDLSFIGQYNLYDLLFHQRQINFTQNTANLAAINIGDTPAYAATNALTYAQTKKDTGVVSLQTLLRRKYGDTTHLSSVLKHRFGNTEITVSPYYSEARSRYRDAPGGYYSDLTATYTGKLNVLFNNFSEAIPDLPTVTGPNNTGSVDLTNLSLFKISSVRSRAFTTRDANFGGFIDASTKLSTKVPVKLFAGIRYDDTSRDIKRYDVNGTISETGSSLAGLADTIFAGHDIGYGYGKFNFQSPYLVFDKYGEAALTKTASLASREFNEETRAGYVRAQVQATSKLTIDGGVRYEKRTPRYSASDLGASPKVALSNSPDTVWDGYYPSLNVTFKPKRNLVLRAGASLTVGYPDFGDTLPVRTLTPYDSTTSVPGRITLPNPNIEPYKIKNFDVTGEYYLPGGGMVSVSGFVKKAQNFIGQVSNQTLTADLASDLGIDFAGLKGDPYTVTYKANFGESTIKGVELSYNQTLKFLPGVLKTLNLQTNYTHIAIDASANASEAALLFKGNQVIADQSALDQQSYQALPDSFNAIVDWKIGKLSFSIAETYTSRQLYGAPWGSNPVTKTIKPSTSSAATQDLLLEHDFVEARWTTDITAAYKFSNRVQLYLKVRNVFNKPITETYEYNGLPRLTTKYGDPLYSFGVKGVW